MLCKSRRQQDDLSKFYYISLRHTLYCLKWGENFVSYVLDEISLEVRCSFHWSKYLKALSNSIGRYLTFEKTKLVEIRKSWLDKEFATARLKRSKRLVSDKSILEKNLSSLSSYSSVPYYEMSEITLLQLVPDSFC